MQLRGNMITDWRIKLNCTEYYSPSSLPNDPADKTLFSKDEQRKCFPKIITSHENNSGANFTNLRSARSLLGAAIKIVLSFFD